MPSFPSHRPRRLRRSETIRSLVCETSLSPSALFLPLLVVPGEGVRRPIGSMAGVEQTSADELLRDAEEALRLGIGGVGLVGAPERNGAAGGGRPSADERRRDAEEALRLGIGGVLLFGIPEHKDETGSSGYGPDNVVSQGGRRRKGGLPRGLGVTADGR